MRQHLSFLIKPASSLCNMHCGYCFYADEAASRECASMGIMTRETTRSLVKTAFEAAAPGGQISFSFQGGEPTLAGLDYFSNFLSYEREFNTFDVRISHAIQTNGLLIDKEWAGFFKKNKFLVGLSVDGDKALHDCYRLDSAEKGTWNRVTQSLSVLKSVGAEVNILCVVTGRSARSPQKVYNVFKKLGAEYLQFIPCLDPMNSARGSMPYSLKPEAYGNFLKGLFDAWYQDWKSGTYVSIRLFEDYVHLAMGMPAGTCATNGSCGSYLVVEGDGGLYPCDFYVLDAWKMCSLGDAPLESIVSGETAKRFLMEGMHKPDACHECRWQRLCGGGCRRDWVFEGTSVCNYYCDAFKVFFSYAETRLQEVARAEETAMRRAGMKNRISGGL